jgi:hypothetical protein
LLYGWESVSKFTNLPIPPSSTVNHNSDYLADTAELRFYNAPKMGQTLKLSAVSSDIELAPDFDPEPARSGFEMPPTCKIIHQPSFRG